ncbi:MAG: C1 family peptidase, partial [Candidatus Pacebacteria bacterium]|nr:C1 family peptidase [Candidatus Paceibacterota bacterium]
MKNKNRYGWKPDTPDQRDFKFIARKIKIPKSVDWRDGMPSVYNQGDLGSCTANAIAAAVDYERKKQGERFISPSRLFIYYNERAMENTVQSDAGASIRDGIKSVKNQGDCPEKEWLYVISKFKIKPAAKCYADALKYEVVKYVRVNTQIAALKKALAGRPVVFGFSVYESFESDAVAKTGIVPLPESSERVLGGHAVVAVGYDDSRQLV